MTSDRFSEEVQGAVTRLQAGGRLFVVEEKPYPFPHKVVVVTNGENYSISYNDFVLLLTHQFIQPVKSSIFDGFPAEEYAISPDR